MAEVSSPKTRIMVFSKSYSAPRNNSCLPLPTKAKYTSGEILLLQSPEKTEISHQKSKVQIWNHCYYVRLNLNIYHVRYLNGCIKTL